jgi:signal transduction histidine kinase
MNPKTPDPKTLELKTSDPETRIRELTAEIESLSYSISHDLRAPLRTITGFSRILLRDYADRLDDEGRELLRMMHDGGKNLNAMIEALLVYSRLERIGMAVSEVNMEALADGLITACKSKYPQRSIRFIRNRFAPAAGDREMVRQALANLLDNAVKFTGPRKEAVIELGCEPDNGSIRYHVKDNGVGFDPGNSGRLFQMFQHFHPPGLFEGAGGGLAVARRIIQRHGGRIWAESKPDAGATFYFILG